MGAAVCHALVGAPDLELVAAVDPGAAGRPLAEVGGPAGTGLVVAASTDALREAGAQAAVDFTVAPAARANLAFCAAHGIHVVCGTTGLGEDDLAALRRAFGAASGANCVLAANFSISAVVLMRLCELAAPHFGGVEIVELHHDNKRDAPSGTALETARRIADARAAAGAGALGADPTTDEVLPGARGGTGPGGIHVHAVRLPGLVAHEEVLFGAPGQALTIRQDSFDRTSFMPGVLLALRAVAARPGLTLGLEPLLGL